MIPKDGCTYPQDVFDFNTVHGIALTRIRVGNIAEWIPAADASFRFTADGWEEVTEMEFSDGSIWRLNQNHTAPSRS